MKLLSLVSIAWFATLSTASADPAADGATSGGPREYDEIEIEAPAASTGDSGAHFQLTGAVLGDALGKYIGGELRGSYSALTFLDVGLGATLGTSPGVLVTARLHAPYAPDRTFRPFLQPRAAIHPSSRGYGGGALGGILVEAGPGRIELGVAGHVYRDVTGYFSYAVFAVAGYEFDIYGKRGQQARRVEIPEPDPDSDSDGISDASDKCPLEAEDRDAFQDDDGCPDKDHDADGIADLADACPKEAEDLDGFEDTDGCPDKDDDADGIADLADGCPKEAEDLDGFQDTDGCPDHDNDIDGIADHTDGCPMEAEVWNAFEDSDGCPDAGKPLASVTSTQVDIHETVFFDTNRARIKKKSYKLLDAVASAISSHAALRVRIEGHCDYRGSDRWNEELSQDRAESVRAYLVKRGVDPGRLEAAGFGRSRPKVEGRRSKALAANRRVEFVIITP